MSIKRFQNKIAESRMALPFTAVYALLVCFACGFVEHGMWMQLALLAVSSFMMLELNNANALIRIYSRMVSCSFLVFAVMAVFILVSVPHAVVQLCFIAFLLLLFSAYQNKGAMGRVFYAFVMLGAASLMFVQIAYFLPVAWVLLFANIMAGGGRTYFASVLGFITPYWIAGGYSLYTGQTDEFVGRLSGLWTFGPLLDVAAVDMHRMVTFGFIVLASLTGIIHFHRNSYKDKIRTRMLFEVFTTLFLCAMVFAVLQPQHADCLMAMMTVCGSPLVGHFISLTNTRLTNAWFVCLLIGALCITVYNVWMQ